MKKFAVLGSPIAHSLSPEIHQAFAQQFNLSITYERLLVKPGTLNEILQVFFQQGGAGVNITSPYKEEAFHWVQKNSPRAQQAQAVNTITQNEQGTLWGDNTDGVGLVRDLLLNHQFPLAQQKILLLGAGGAAKGILPALLAEKPLCVAIANRTFSKAEKLVTEFAPYKNLSAISWAETMQSFDLVIQATAAGITGTSLTVPKQWIQNAVCYDLTYGKSAQFFLPWAQQEGAKACFSGLGMLVEQAAEAFYLWHGVRPVTRSVLMQMEKLLASRD